MCIYVCITVQRECDLFDLQWNVHKIWVLHLELFTGVPEPKVGFRDAYGPKIQNLTTPLLPRPPIATPISFWIVLLPFSKFYKLI